MKLTKKQYKNIVIASLSLIVWNLAYLCSTFYVQFQDYYGITDGQIGKIISFLGLATIIGYAFGGLLADRFAPKKMLIASCILSGVLGICMTITKSYAALCAIHFGLGLSGSLISWDAFLKFMRFTGTDEQQGKIFGSFELIYAVIGVIMGYGVVASMNSILEKYDFSVVILVHAGLIILAAVLMFFFLNDPDYSRVGGDDAGNKFSFKLIGEALKQPVTWLNALIVLGLSIAGAATVYVAPLLQNVFGMSVTLVLAMNLFNSRVTRIALTPLGGAIIDRMGKSSTMVIISALVAIVCFVVMALIPQVASYGMLFLIIWTIGAIPVTMSRPALYTPVGEAAVPAAITGTVMGIVSSIGYCQDLWFYNLCGRWLDKYGNAAYNYIWYFAAGALVMVMVCSATFQIYLNRKHKRELENA